MENEALIEGWQVEMRIRGRTDATASGYRSSIREFLKSTKDAKLEKTTETQLKTHLARMRKGTANDGTINSHFAALTSLFDYAHHEGIVKSNPVPPFRKRYLDRLVRSRNSSDERRQLISVEEARQLMAGTLDIRTRTILAILFKTGIRRDEVSTLDVADIDWRRNSITLKPHAKRTNSVVYFDDETARLLRRWIQVRRLRCGKQDGPLFVNQRDGRLGNNGIYNAVTAAAINTGFHDPKGPIRARFTPHCCRHWFTTHLRRAGMPTHYIAELRGDSDARTLDIYTHIDHDELRDSYLTHIPRLDL